MIVFEKIQTLQKLHAAYTINDIYSIRLQFTGIFDNLLLTPPEFILAI